jgi:hypothetical protein
MFDVPTSRRRFKFLKFLRPDQSPALRPPSLRPGGQMETPKKAESDLLVRLGLAPYKVEGMKVLHRSSNILFHSNVDFEFSRG